jgi:hypothetical protein
LTEHHLGLGLGVGLIAAFTVFLSAHFTREERTARKHASRRSERASIASGRA